MPSPFEIESLEIITGAVLMVVAVGTVAITIAGSLAYFLTREPAGHIVAAHSAAVPSAVPESPAVWKARTAEVPQSIAG